MDRIYSRKRIKLPIFKFNLKKNGEYSKRNANRMKVIVITIIASQHFWNKGVPLLW